MAYILTLRMEKGSMLTYEELDDNFLFLKQKVEALESADTSADAVLFTPQELTPGQKQIVWGNIGSMAVDFSNLPANLSAEAKSSFKQKLDIPESFEITDYVSFSPGQRLNPAEQLTARNNINATDRRLEELASDLTEEERAKIRQKISAASLEDVGNIIDDTQASGDTTYSSNLIDQKLNLKLDADDLNGLLTNPTYDSDTHIFTMDVIGGTQFQIDFPIEALITNVDLDNDNNLVITFEDGSVTAIPLNTLLVGVVKSVNGKTPNTQGQVVITAEDIADLPAVPTNYITTNTNQTVLSGNKTTSGVWTFENNQVPITLIRPAGNNSIRFTNDSTSTYLGFSLNGDNFVVSDGVNLETIANRRMWVDNTGLVSSRNGFNKYGQNDTQILLAGGGHRPVSDFALAGSLDNELDNKANTDGSNTTGGWWSIDALTNNNVGVYVEEYIFSNADIGIPSTDALGSAIGITLMSDGSPLAIAENINPDWDGYIYRTGEPLAGYPDHAKIGNYIIESKHRFRVHKHDTLDDLDAGVGKVILNPYNAIEHQYFDVNIFEAMDVLELHIQAPERDELTGHEIRRNFYGQRISVNVNTNANVVFTNIQGVSFPNGGLPGVYKFVWDDVWLFDGYSPNEF